LGVILHRRHAALTIGLAVAALAAPSAAAQAPSDEPAPPAGAERLPIDPAGIAHGVTTGVAGALEGAPEPVGGVVQALPPLVDGALAAPGPLPVPDEGPSRGAGPPSSPAPHEPAPTGIEPPAALTGGEPADSSQISGGGAVAGTPAKAEGSDGGDRGRTAGEAKGSAPEVAAAHAAARVTTTSSSGDVAGGGGPAGGAGIANLPPPEREHERGALERIVTVVPWPVDVAIALLAGLLALMTVRSVRDRRRLKEAERLAMTDPLTGLPNRQDSALYLQRLAAASARSGRPVAIALVDLDHFKAINDDFGHQAGDATLRGVARALRSELRDADHVGRLGGEEFLAILPDAGPEEAVAAAERIRERIAAMPRKVDRQVTASLGVATMPRDATGVVALMAAADRALYAAKEAGRDRVVWAGALDDAPQGSERRTAVPA
jgi:diguanylate cyclase (GGDEF)-like protein